MAPDSDVFGHALLDWTRGATSPEILERDDGFTQVGAGPEVYLSSLRGWPSAERKSLRLMRGRVMDVGCGAGRVALELQSRGLDVVGLDSSPLASRAATLRGVREVWSTPIEHLGGRVASFDSFVLFGNNFGIFETPTRARQILTRLAATTKPNAQIFAESTAAYCGGAPGFDRSYYHRNKVSGRSPGQLKLRYHYGHLVGPWFRWLYVTRSEMRSILVGTGWHLERVIGEQLGEPYVAILEKD
ncbi:MAG: class I SAM-dependent methyltransferase [Acidimicrobiales bacterium]